MQTLAYKYGILKSGIDRADLVEAQVLAAHRYRNELIHIERGKRSAQREASLTDSVAASKTAVEVAESAVEAAVREIAAARAATGTKTTSPELRARLVAAKARRLEAKRSFTEARRLDTLATWLAAPPTGLPDVDAYIAAKRAYDAFHGGPNAGERAALREACEQAAFAIQESGRTDHPVRLLALRDAVTYRAQLLRRDARAICGVPHGTYTLVEQAQDASAESMPLWDGAQPNDPRFIRWRGEGKLGVQLAPPLPVSRLLSCEDRWARLERIADDPKGRLHRLYMRVGSDGREPVWASWKVVLHRPLPENALITRIIVGRRVDGPRAKWDAVFTVNIPSASAPEMVRPAVGVDIGWRKIGDAIRVASWASEDGDKGELRLPSDLLGKFGYAESVRSIGDTLFETTRLRLCAWKRDTKAALPEWFTKATETLAQWRARDRLRHLTRRWSANRFDGDEDGFVLLGALVPGNGEGNGWLHRDRHLWQIETGVRLRAERRRLDIYRVFAADMAERFGALVLEKFDLRGVAELPPVESAATDNARARAQRVKAAVSDLRAALVQAFHRRGKPVSYVNPAGTTGTCSACGHANHFDAAANVCFTCASCGVIHDQDENAAVNILARCERGSDALTPGTARVEENQNDSGEVRETRWAKKRRLRDERLAAARTAREALQNVAE